MDYWTWRAERRLEANEAGAKEALRVLGKAFQRATRDIAADIERIERRVGSRFGLTPLEVRALLDQPCGREEYLELLAKINGMQPGPARDALMAKAAAPGYAHRIGRLENLQDQVRARTVLLSQQYEGLVSSQLADTVRKAYARAGFDAQAVIGYASPWSGIHEGAVRRILQAPWSGMRFSERIWKNQEALVDLLNETITSGFLTGRSTRKTIEEVQQKMAVGYRAAERLVRTETAAMVAMTDKMAYEKARIKRYRYMATLDSITSKICMTLDNEVFDVADMEIGKNCPPMHPHCRSTTTAVIDGVDLSDAQRRSKDPATGMPVRVPRSMSYKEWEGLQEKTYGITGIMGEAQEHKRYLEVLGPTRVPEDLPSFHKLKDNAEKWGLLQWEFKYDAKNKAKNQEEILKNAHFPINILPKITGYSLNPEHSIGKHKALVFESALGYNLSNAEALVHEIEKGILRYRARFIGHTMHGDQYEVIMLVDSPKGRYPIVTGWIYRPGEEEPRMVTAYVDKNGRR